MKAKLKVDRTLVRDEGNGLFSREALSAGVLFECVRESDDLVILRRGDSCYAVFSDTFDRDFIPVVSSGLVVPGAQWKIDED